MQYNAMYHKIQYISMQHYITMQYIAMLIQCNKIQCNAIIALCCIELSLYCIAECRLQCNGQCNTIVLQCNTIQVPFLQERSMWSGKIAIRRGRNKSRRYVAEILQFLRKKSYLPLISLISHYIDWKWDLEYCDGCSNETGLLNPLLCETWSLGLQRGSIP